MPTKTIRKGLIGIEDLSQGTGTFSRSKSDGTNQTLNSIPIYKGTGSPEGIVTASVGSLFFRTDGGAGTTHYMKQTGSGNTGWQAIVASSGTGILTLNGLTADPQSFAVGTSGTDFAISSVTATHTFNLPTASASNRGALSSADWSTFNAKAPTANPTFTGTVTIPTPFTLGAVSVLPTGTELNFVDGVTSSIQTQLDAKAPLASPTFTGTVTIPTPFTLGAVSVLPTGTELNFVDGVTSSIQTQLDGKAASSHTHAAGDITSGTLAVAQGGTNLASGTSGGVLGYTAAGTLASSVALTANALVLGAGAGATPTPMGSLGTTTTLLHGNAAGAPTFAAVAKADAAATFVHTDQDNTYSTGAQSLAAATSLLVPASAGYAPTADGSLGYDTTQDAWVGGGNGGVKGFFPRVLYMTNVTTEGNGATQADTTGTGGNINTASGTAGTSELIFASKFTIPANFFFANKAIKVGVVFDLTTSASAPTGTVRFKLGANNMAATGAIAVGNSMTGRSYTTEVMIQGTAAAGASVNVESGGFHWLAMGSPATTPNTVAQPVAVATNGSLAMQISWQWGAATAANFVILRQMWIMEMY